MPSLQHQILYLFLIAIPVASIAWTVTNEEVFREPREFCVKHSKQGRNVSYRKFFYLFTCEYCFSHYISILMLVITKFQIIYPDWRGYLLSGFSLVWVANFYMSLFRRLRLDIKKQKTDVELKEELLDGKKSMTTDPEPDPHGGDPDSYRDYRDYQDNDGYQEYKEKVKGKKPEVGTN
jgi:hypothetical protein